MAESIEQQFEAFWQAYPKRIKKHTAYRQYIAALYYGNANPESILRGVEAYKKDIVTKGTEFQYIASPDKWLADGRWEDIYEINLPPPRSEADVLRDARLSGYQKTGFWKDEWGDKPERKLQIVAG